MPEFTRFTETITKKQDKRVVNITVKPTVIDCTGSVWFTDLMLQEGDKVTGFVINTETFLEKYDGDDARSIRFRRWLPGVYRLRWVKVLIRQLSKQRLLPVMNLTFLLLRGSA